MNKTIIINNDIQELEKLHLFIDEICEEQHLDADLQMNLNLALEEAVSNVVLYAYPEKSGEKITISAQQIKDTLVFTISDKGTAFDPTEAPEADVTLSAEDRPIGGLGIFIVKNIMNEVTYQRINDTNVLTLSKKVTNKN
jgi:anti-sigma regulatory factor (Ser/Thr protein kinase)